MRSDGTDGMRGVLMFGQELPLVRLATALSLVGLMALGSALMWIGLPVGLLWLASHLQTGTNAQLGPYVLVIAGLPVGMVAIGWILGWLDRLFARVTGYDPNHRPVPRSWMRSMRDGRGSAHSRTVLDVVMIVSVAVAGALFLVWFFLLAHPGMPQT